MTDMRDVLIAARRKVLASPYIIPLMGVDIGIDPPGKTWDDGWVFRARENTAAPEINPTNTGKASITMHLRDPWSSPGMFHTLRFRQLKFSIYSDPSRSTSNTGLNKANDADTRCDRIATALINEFNDVGNVDHLWPNDVLMVSCLLYNDLHIIDVPGFDGMVEGTLSFALELM